MADATYAIPSFHGGEISDFAQGRFDKPDYRISLNICLNSFPIEIGAWTRRPGTQFGGATRGGLEGRVIKFDFEQANAVTLEFTDGWLRFRNGAVLLTTNDDATVTAISAANPAVVTLSSAVTWLTGDAAFFNDLGDNNPLLQNRRFTLTKSDTTHFSLADEITGVAIDGATLGSFVSGTISRVQELTTVYAAGAWSSIRSVQAEKTAILLSDTLQPQALIVETDPAQDTDAQFSISEVVFNDGPYLDPFTNGALVTASAVSGIVNLQLSFPAYNATKAYAVNAFVTSGSINYISLVDQNVGNTPVSSPTDWAATEASAAINDGQGFLATDIGRLVRLFDEPAEWDAATSYGVGTAVSYNPTGQPGAAAYYTALTTTVGDIPGSDLANWQISPANVVIWTWGRIVSLSNVIDPSLALSTSIGGMTSGGGLNAVFDGIFAQNAAGSAQESTGGGTTPDGTTISLSSFVGKNYSAATPQAIKQCTVYPSADRGLAFGSVFYGFGGAAPFVPNGITLNLRASMTPPASSSSGTLIGTSGLRDNGVAPTTITSTDQVTAWNYVWIELVTTATIFTGFGFANSYTLTNCVGQLSFFSPTGTGTSSGVSVEILGPAMLRTTAIRTWRLGVYSDTTGWPTCGTYHEGRAWFGGAIPNRFDACVSNGIVGNVVNFAPTSETGAVAANSAISYTLNSDGVNPMFWLQPDLQGVVIGTQAGEWLVQAPSTGPIAPTNIAARRMTKHGSSNIQPVRTEHANIFVKRYGRKLLEYFADAYSGKFSAPNLADKAQHITREGIAELAYTGAVTPVVWGRDGAGALFGVTYKRDTLSTTQPPTFAAWHRHTLGSERTVESICSGPSVGGDLDTLTMVTSDGTVGGRHVELLTDAPDEETALSSAWFLDDAVNPTSMVVDETAITGAPYGGVTLNGLWHLNGSTVQVFAGGLDCGDRGDNSETFTDFVVANGAVFVPFGDGASAGSGRGLFTPAFAAALDLSEIVVGFTYNSDGQLVRPIAPADSGARNGPALGKTRRNHQYSVLVSNTLGISFGGTFDVLRPALFRQANGNPIADLTMFSGVYHDALNDDYSYDGMVAWRVSRPWPANLVAISGNVQTQDR